MCKDGDNKLNFGFELNMDGENCKNSENIISEMNFSKAFLQVKKAFESAQIEDAAFDADVLIKHVTGKDRRIYSEEILTKKQAEKLEEYTKKRLKRVPLQYIIGEWDFMGFTLKVGEGVLIPRSDTEVVCETAIETARELLLQNGTDENCEQAKKSNTCCSEKDCNKIAMAEIAYAQKSENGYCINIIDLCSGSGAIAIGIKKSVPQAKLTAVELYKDAFYYLRENVKNLAPGIAICNDDIFNYQNKIEDNSLDMIVSNPPYVTHDEMKLLEPELLYEPKTALVADDNGLKYYKHIAKAYKQKLKKGGAIVFEIGCTQGEKVCDILAQNGYTKIEIIKDTAGKNRCVRAFK